MQYAIASFSFLLWVDGCLRKGLQRFKREVKLAREESRPTQAGLKDYIKQLEVWA